jgi:hypothetical protein
MKLQKIVLSLAVSVITFGAGVGLVTIVSFLGAPSEPAKLIAISDLKPLPPNLPEPLPIKTEEPQTPEAKEYVHKEFDKPGDDGYYYLIGTPSGKTPKGFKDFEYFELWTSEYEGNGKETPTKPFGSVTAKLYLKIPHIKISEKKISFKTETFKSTFYQFEGKFVEELFTRRYDDGSGVYTDAVPLKGVLTKWKNGVKVAEAQVIFGYTMGC